MAVRVRGARVIALGLGLALAGCGSPPAPKAATTVAPTATTYATPFIAPTATPVPPGQWTQVAALAHMTLAPSNPTIAYQIGPTGVLRSGDSGATWSDLGSPRISGVASLIQPQLVSAFVSPANPDILFMILSGYSNGSCGQGASAHENTAADAPPGATTWCEDEFVSADRGGAWSRAQTPVPGLMTSALTNFADAPVQGEMQRQGSRLYALVINETTGQQHGPPPGRLVVSADGGLTWRLADGGLVAAGEGLWDYAATPSGSTIFAITEPLSTKPAMFGPAPRLTLWRSDNAGATWTRPGALPTSGVGAMRAALTGGVPTLFLQTFDSAGKGSIEASPWGASGRWQTAPAGPLGQNYTVLMTVSNGSLLVASGAGAILAWRAGASGWRQVAADPELTYPLDYASLLATTGGGQRLWLVGTGTRYGDTVVEYSTLTT